MERVIVILKDTQALKDTKNPLPTAFNLTEGNILKADKVVDFGDYWLLTLSSNAGEWLVKKTDTKIN